jgi:CheY-like chemotaxis protein
VNAKADNSIRILVVEDDQLNAELIRRVLTHAGYQPVLADSADRAMELARSERFNLVVSDIAMPVKDGWTLMRELHERHGLRGIAVSGLAFEVDRYSSAAAGFSAHLTKPIDVATLLSTIEGVLKGATTGCFCTPPAEKPSMA